MVNLKIMQRRVAQGRNLPLTCIQLKHKKRYKLNTEPFKKRDQSTFLKSHLNLSKDVTDRKVAGSAFQLSIFL